jgi:very-short-patch-repair endonuclease
MGMKKAKIFYFSLTDEQTKDEKLQWFGDTKLGNISFENITPDKNNDWIDLAKNADGFESLISLADKETRISKNIEKEKSVFKLYSNGINTSRDEWTYDFSKESLGNKLDFFINEYNIEVDRWIDFRNKNQLSSVDESSPILSQFIAEKDIIKWSSRLKRDKLLKERKCEFNGAKIVCSLYRPFVSKFLYFDYIPLDLVAQQAEIFPYRKPNLSITINTNSDQSFNILASAKMIDLHFIGDSVSFPLYRYDEKGDRIENITDWALERFREHYLPSPPAPLPQERGVREPSPPAPLPQERGARLEQERDAGLDPDLVRLVGARREIPEVLLQKAKELRQKQTPAEQMLWQCLRANQIHGAKFRRQHNIGQYIVDFYCHTAKLVIELDGGIHELQKDRDSDRDTYLKANGLQVLRLQNEEITQNLPQVLQTITNHLSLFLPSPAGEGQGVRAETPAGEGQGESAETPTSILSPSPAGEGLGVRAETPARETITKLDIFHYTYAVLHHPAYRTKYELNLKREFPRLPFYEDFHQWVSWGKALMDLHLNYEIIEPYGLKRVEIATKDNPKAKLKADKTNGVISLDDNTQLTDVPAIAWEYKLGNRSALEWILDQYKEKKPKDPTIAKLFNAYKFADYKEQVVDLLQRVCTVSVKTMEIIQQMPTT